MSSLQHHVLVEELEGFALWRRHGQPHGLADGYFVVGISRDFDPPTAYAIEDSEASSVFSSARLSDEALIILAPTATSEALASSVFSILVSEARMFRESFEGVSRG